VSIGLWSKRRLGVGFVGSVEAVGLLLVRAGYVAVSSS
jgi:hypothetical protein